MAPPAAAPAPATPEPTAPAPAAPAAGADAQPPLSPADVQALLQALRDEIARTRREAAEERQRTAEERQRQEERIRALEQKLQERDKGAPGAGAPTLQPGAPEGAASSRWTARWARTLSPAGYPGGKDGGKDERGGTGIVDRIVDRYQDGIVVAQTPNDANVPFLLKFNINTQERYLNTKDSDRTFTDHLGVVHEVHRRNDITVNRSMFILGGYIFDPRLLYSSTVWTSAGSNSIVIAGNIGWQFDKALTLTAGYTGVPGSRSLVNTFPFFTGSDRSMADNFFRPGFTQGLWASGQPVKGLNYLAFLGNGLNTLNISAAKIDTNLMFSGSVWWEPLGDYGPPGKSRNMYDDYYASKKARIRLGTAFTRAREDRFSDLDTSSPENTAMHNSDGVLLFSTGAFAPGVTVDQATYRMWAIDGGVKWNGLAINGQHFIRWINDFVADGPLPLDSTYDHGFEVSASYFVKPRKVALYGRGSMVFGQFRDSWEYAGGVKWYPVSTERMWLQGEVMRVKSVPYGGTFTPYTAGLTGLVPMLQGYLAF